MRPSLPFAILAVILAAAHAGSAAPAAEEPPNVVLIISDDQAWTDFGFMGHPTIRTPHLDRLAEQSAVFPRGYVPSSLCRPSLATMISGLYPHQHKLTGNDPPPGVDRSEMLRHIRRIPTLPRLLAEKGYVSHQSGKWWEGSYELGGFTAGMTHGDPRRRGRHGDEGLKIGREGMQPIFDFIEAHEGKPFFIWYAPFLPHTPHNPPQRLLDKYAEPGKSIHVARYQAMCEWFDETCGELLDYLDRDGLAENTLVAFVVDNGWIQREDARGFAPKSKRSPYDGGVRTPILLRWPGRIEPARYDDTLVSSIDLAPTILTAAGLKPAPEMPGIDLLEVARAGGKTDRQAIFGDVYEHDVVDIDDPVPGLLYRWCVEGKWKLILPADPDESPELYDLAADPHETENLAEERPQIVARLTRLIDDWWPGRR
jgi:arylsulfatase A-like enzyme